ncbi:RDD family protein [Chitinophaga sp. SYP-B3965]|uniref:RDD family protein n=1 Tax=Chitinophaga sp. SYP-B3965 TaxID=2663120 RepID=UPI001299F13D|nr:RDD family protein [Chitinophaga sp. SYP-B3965]
MINHLDDVPVTEPTYPVLVKRVQSTFIDFLIIVLLMLLASMLLNAIGDEEDTPTWINVVLFLTIWGLYEPLAIAYGCTVGNYITRIRVVDINNYQKKIALWKAFVRYALKASLGWVSFLSIHSNPQRRAIHDLGAGSVMIQKD